LEYLLCFDPVLLNALNSNDIVFEERLKSILEDTKNKKINIQKNINNFIVSTENSDYFISLLQNNFHPNILARHNRMVSIHIFQTTIELRL
jgi:hypothetical protein